MTSQLLRLGAGGMNENEIARKLADVGAQLAPRFDTDRAGLSLRTLSSAPERRQALDIFDAHPATPGISGSGSGTGKGHG